MNRKYIALLCLWAGMVTTLNAQDIVVTDSTSTEWGEDLGGGGLNPSDPSDPVTSITISRTTLTLEGGERYRLTAKVNSTAANKAVTWSTADATIASVDEDGTVMGLKKGSTTITATAQGNTSLKATCKVTVTSDYVPPVNGWVLPWGKEEPWQMKYQYFELSNYKEPAKDSSGKEWKQLGYNDSKWATLTGPMSNENRWGCDYYYWGGENNCFCLRREFELLSVSDETAFTFYSQHDDAIKVYINGQLVVDETDWTENGVSMVVIPNEVFHVGTNQLAIYIEQWGGGAFLDYALYQKTPLYGSDVRLPNVPFEFLYQAKDYDEEGHFIPNHKKANLKEAMLQLTENIPTLVNKKLLRITDRCEGYLDRWEKNSTVSGAHFFRTGDNSMTIICKVAPNLSPHGGAADFISNRGGGYNYMLRIGGNEGFYLHTSDAYSPSRTLYFDSEDPQVLAVRAFGEENYILLENLTTGKSLRIDGINWGGGNNIFKFFYNDGGEFYLGDFFWAYYSFELLTDQQVKQVVDAVEGKVNILKGDANGDGTVNVTDVMLVVGYILHSELPVFIFNNADVDENQTINVTDAMGIVNIILKKELYLIRN